MLSTIKYPLLSEEECDGDMYQSDCSKWHTLQWRNIASISLFAYNFLMDSPISTIFNIKMYIDNQKKIASTLLLILQTRGR